MRWCLNLGLFAALACGGAGLQQTPSVPATDSTAPGTARGIPDWEPVVVFEGEFTWGGLPT